MLRKLALWHADRWRYRRSHRQRHRRQAGSPTTGWDLWRGKKLQCLIVCQSCHSTWFSKATTFLFPATQDQCGCRTCCDRSWELCSRHASHLLGLRATGPADLSLHSLSPLWLSLIHPKLIFNDTLCYVGPQGALSGCALIKRLSACSPLRRLH